MGISFALMEHVEPVSCDPAKQWDWATPAYQKDSNMVSESTGMLVKSQQNGLSHTTWRPARHILPSVSFAQS